MEIAECGAACLAMLLGYYGASVPLSALRRACGTARDGTSAAALARAAREFGLTARAFKVDVAALHRCSLPAILHWELRHFVVLERVRGDAIEILDPAVGRRRVPLQEAAEAFSGILLSFEPGEHFVPLRPPGWRLKRYLPELAPFRSAIALLVLAALLLQALLTLLPAADQVLVDQLIVPRNADWLAPFAAILGVVAGGSWLLNAVRTYLLQALSTSLCLSLTSAFVKGLLERSLTFVQQRTHGDLMQRVAANAELSELLTTLMLAVFDALTLVGFSALMLAYEPRLGAAVLLLNACRVVLVARMSRRVRPLVTAELARAGSEQATAVHALSSPEAVRAFGAERLLMRRHADRMSERLSAALDVRRASAHVGFAVGAFDALATGTLLWMGGFLVLAERMSVGTLVGFFALSLFVQKPMQALAEAISKMSYAHGILARLDDVLDAEREPSGTTPCGPLSGALTLSNVAFRHSPTSPWVCRGVSLSVQPGEKIAIVGRSGAGKTTLARLMLGLLAPTEGTVSLDGRPLAELDLRSFRAQIGVVLQETSLLDASIYENLLLGAPAATREDVRWACRQACIADFVEGLPEGYDTRLGPGGVSLSGGQRQRLSLARALVKKPRLLLLDEATSSLDLFTEALVHQNLSRLGCTRIVIAHRLATVRDAERVLVVDDGSIVEEGTYAELLAAGGAFAAMVGSLEP